MPYTNTMSAREDELKKDKAEAENEQEAWLNEHGD
jgi:hypothetical protein